MTDISRRHWSYRALFTWHGLPVRPSPAHLGKYALAVFHSIPAGLTSVVIDGGGGWTFNRLLATRILFDQHVLLSGDIQELHFDSRTPEFDRCVVKWIGGYLHAVDAAAGRHTDTNRPDNESEHD